MCKHTILFPATNRELTVTRICVYVNEIVSVVIVQSDQVSAVSIEQGIEVLNQIFF